MNSDIRNFKEFDTLMNGDLVVTIEYWYLLNIKKALIAQPIKDLLDMMKRNTIVMQQH